MNISKCKCGGNAIIRQDHFSVSYGDWKIFCEKCGMQTGWTKNKEDAIELWNRTMGSTEDFSAVERTAKVEMLLCGNCHESNICDIVTRQHYKYCPNCGARLEWE